MNLLDHTWVHGKRWDDSGWGLVTRKTYCMRRALGLWASLTSRRVEGLEIKPIHGQWFNQSCLYNETPTKTLNIELSGGNFPVFETISGPEVVHAGSTGIGHGSFAFRTLPDLALSSIWLVYIFYKTNCTYSAFSSFVSCFSELSNLRVLESLNL